MAIEPFRIAVPDSVLQDLRDRLGRSRFAVGASDGPDGAAGADPGYLRELVKYWSDGFDWRAAEAALNELPHHVAVAGGRRVHFVWLRSGKPGALPLIMTHGWPGSFVEMLPTARLLSDEFDVIVPSLPGFLFSEPSADVFTRRIVAGVWHELMTEVLGYERFGAYGSDIGGGVTTWLGALFPGDVVGVHLATSIVGGDLENPPLTPQEQDFFQRRDAYDAKDGGYSEIMCTKPDTLAAALLDSPVGLAAWIVDKFRAWSDCDGDLERRWDKDTIAAVLTMYWATASIGTSFRQYYDYEQHNTLTPVINVPAAVTLATEPMFAGFPRSLAERLFSDLRQWSTPGRGGHFIAHEEPQLMADEIRSFFRSLT
ncbi:MAG TPA: epoxide hydrolase [Streptosporangiaceae bacterium]